MSSEKPLSHDQETSSVAGQREADVTISAPSFPGQPASLRAPSPTEAPAALDTGAVIADFQVLRLLGRGAAGAVYLARQQSLERRVALKVVRNVGSEARTMAALEHPHIVQVYSETVDAASDVRLLCMQYVPGVTLAAVIARLRKLPREQLSGAALLSAIDAADSGGDLAFDTEALRDRERLAAANYVAAICWIMARVAEALHFAHERGVLHRDIKPANILINPYGRPLLADFSLSLATLRQQAGEEVFGGTLAYMSPEHLAAFRSGVAVGAQTVDHRSDIYSLGVVLYELLALKLPHGSSARGPMTGELLQEMEQARRSPPARLHTPNQDAPHALDCAVRRCLAGSPGERYADAGQLAQALDGCRQLETARQHLPPAGAATRAIARAPVAATIALAFLPHVPGCVFTLVYLALLLVPRLSQQQKTGLLAVSAIYSAVVFLSVLIVVLILYVPPTNVWRRLRADRPPPTEAVDRARRRILTAPLAATWLSSLGWLPLLAFLPAGLHLIGAGTSWREFAHLAVSVFLSLLITATYSYFALQYCVLRILYPQAWASAGSFLATARTELAAVPLRVRWFQIGAGLVPLAGATLILALGPEAFETGSSLAFRSLIFCLIVLGMAGMSLATHAGGLIVKSVDALTRVA
jgi:hypothetical protein